VSCRQQFRKTIGRGKVLYFSVCSVKMTTWNFQSELQVAQNYVKIFVLLYIFKVYEYFVQFSIFDVLCTKFMRKCCLLLVSQNWNRTNVFSLLNPLIHKIKGMVEDEILTLECLKTTFRRNLSSNLKEINKNK